MHHLVFLDENKIVNEIHKKKKIVDLGMKIMSLALISHAITYDHR